MTIIGTIIQQDDGTISVQSQLSRPVQLAHVLSLLTADVLRQMREAESAVGDGAQRIGPDNYGAKAREPVDIIPRGPYPESPAATCPCGQTECSPAMRKEHAAIFAYPASPLNP